MKFKIFSALCVGACIPLASCQCTPYSSYKTEASVAEGSQYCSIVRVPKDWGLPLEYALPSPGIYRETSNGDGILFSLASPFSGKPVAISEKYWIDFEHRGRIRAASDSEWESASAARMSGTPRLVKLDGPKPEGLITKDDRTVTFNGHLLPRSGDIAYRLLWTPGDRYLQIQSFSGWCDNCGNGDVGKVASDGPFYIDIYELATGKRVALIKGNWCDWTPSGALDAASWISDRDLVMPFGYAKREMIVCRFKK